MGSPRCVQWYIVDEVGVGLNTSNSPADDFKDHPFKVLDPQFAADSRSETGHAKARMVPARGRVVADWDAYAVALRLRANANKAARDALAQPVLVKLRENRRHATFNTFRNRS